MAEAAPDLYAELGVPPDADARAIKVAYFALVRQFPPETHPERFQRIRRAYEVLSDPGQRAAYDEARAAPPEPEDPEATALWDTAREAREAGDLEAELRALRRLVELRPALERPREILAEQLLDHGQAEEAERLLRSMVDEQPGHAGWLLRWSRALRELGRPDEALEAIRRARACGPADAAGFQVALADALAGLRLYGEARAALAEATRLEGAERPVPPFERRLSAWLVEEGKAEEGVAALERAIDAWAAAPPEERRDGVAFLAGFAAFLLQRDQWVLANRVLARARAADPGASPGAFPDWTWLHASELPTEAWNWLHAQQDQAEWMGRYFVKRRRAWITMGLLLSLFLWLVLSLAFGHERPFDPDGWLWLAGTLAILGGGVAGCFARAWQVHRSAFGHGLVLHALHLLEVHHDRVRVTPLFSITGADLRPQANQPNLVEARFKRRGWGQAKVTVDGRAGAEEVAQAVMAQRARALELLAEGTLHQERRWNLFPAELVGRGGWARRLGLLRPRRLAAQAVVLLAVCAGLGLLAGRSAAGKAEAKAWLAADRAATVKSYGDFLRAWPAGEHAAVAGQRRVQLLAGARERLAGAGAGPALLALFDAWTAAGKPMPIVVEDEYVGPEGGGGDLLVPWTLLDAKRGTRESRRHVDRLGGILSTAARSYDVQVVQAPGSTAQRPFLRLRLSYGPSGEELAPSAAAPRRAVALAGSWTLELGRVGTRELEWLGGGSVDGPETVRVKAGAWTAPAGVAAARVYGVVLDDMADRVAAATAAALGLRPGRAP